MSAQAAKSKGSRHRSISYRLSTTNAVILKDADIFFLAKRDGSVPLGGKHGFGLYYHDCRFLDGYELKVGNVQPEGLVAAAASSFRAIFELTNPELTPAPGVTIKNRRIGIKWERIIESGKLTLLDWITFRNFDIDPIDFPVSLTFQAGFQDIFIVHGGGKGKRTGKLRAPVWDNGVLRFAYKGVDKIHRGLAIHFLPDVEPTSDDSAKLQMHLKPGESQDIRVSLVLAESSEEARGQPHGYTKSDFGSVEDAMRRAAIEWAAKHTEIECDSRLLTETMERSLADHLILRSTLDKDHYFAGGLPWFCALFGRDSLISALQMLAYSPSLAAQTLHLLARFQGQRVDPSRDEEPGKIHHELRCGELANSKQIAQTPYYGTVDATPLFLILLCEHAAWSGDLTLFHQLRSSVEAALEWMSKYGDLDKDGYLKYKCKAKKGLANQGWKDSGNGIVNEDGSLAEPPIALVEVQGYVYLAKTSLADLYRRAAEPDRADQLLQEAAKLRSHFNQDFWLQDKSFYAMALQNHNQPASVISSNPGQALWSGIVDSNRIKLVADRLMGEDMFSGWGIRTLSEHERRYNPIGYHLGTVWPHDNSIIAIGLRKYGLDDDFQRVFSGILEAASRFEHHRLPELFSGFARKDYGVPVPYPEACHPQVWAAGAIPMMLQSALGLVPLGFEKRLRIVRPVLPDSVQHLEIRRLKVANATVNLRFERTTERRVAVKVLHVDGELDVSVEPE